MVKSFSLWTLHLRLLSIQRWRFILLNFNKVLSVLDRLIVWKYVNSLPDKK